MKRAVVTGATGFIGSRMCRHLADQGWRVGAIVRPGRRPCCLENGLAKEAVLEFSGDIEIMAGFLSDFRPDAVFHFAALYAAAHGAADMEPLIRDNILFGAGILEGMRQAGVGTIVNAGTSWQNSVPDDPVYAPANLYAASKQAFEDLLRYYVHAEGFSAVTIRLFDTYGEKDVRPKVLRLLMRSLMNGSRLELSPGGQELDLVHVSDVCRAFAVGYELARRGAPRTGEQVYGLSSGNRLTLRALAALLEEVTGRRLAADWGARPYRRGEVMRLQENYQALPGWRPEVPLREGLRNAYLGFKEEAGA